MLARSYRLTLRQAKSFRCTAEHLMAKRDGGSDDQGKHPRGVLVLQSDASPSQETSRAKSLEDDTGPEVLVSGGRVLHQRRVRSAKARAAET